MLSSVCTHMCLKENPPGGIDRRKREEKALCCSLFISGHSHNSNSPTKDFWLFPDPSRWFSNVLIWGAFAISMRSNTLVAAGKLLLCFIELPPMNPQAQGVGRPARSPVHSVTQRIQAEPHSLWQAAITQQGLLSHLYLLLKAGQEGRGHNGFSLFF